ncbi:helix-turn-helix domain-containing protein [Arthrobacter sp. CAN_C5]|nr:hypothetical protein [Arthrobacter sp. CAN_C5]
MAGYSKDIGKIVGVSRATVYRYLDLGVAESERTGSGEDGEITTSGGQIL